MRKPLQHPILICLLLFSSVILAQTPIDWHSRGMGGGGAVYAPSISPFNPDEAWLSCDMSVISRTSDFGITWRTVGFDTLAGKRNSTVNFTSHPDTMYVEAADQYTSRNYPKRSSDGGSTWAIIPSGSYWGTYGSFRLFANQKNAKQVVASSYTNVCFSNDYGNSFTIIHTASIQGTPFIHLAGVLYTNDSIYISTDKGLIVSPDSGISWNSFIPYSSMGIPAGTGGEGVVSFGGAVSDHLTRFFCVTLSNANLTNRTEPRDIQYFKKLYRIDWPSNSSWTDITPNLKNAGQTLNDYNFVYQVTMNPNNPDTLYFTGQTRSPATSAGARMGTVFKTTDGGNTFSNVFLRNNNPNNAGMTTGWVGAANFTPWEHTWNSLNTTEGLCIDPNNVNRLMRSDFSIVCTSENGGATWDQRYVSSGEHPALTLISRQDLYKSNGLQTTVCHWVHWMSPTRMLLTYSDLLLNESNDGGLTWGFLYDSLWSQKVNDIQMICQSPSGRLYAPEGEVLGNNGDWSDYRLGQAPGKIMFSDDAAHWHLLRDFGAPVSWASFDPNDVSVLYTAVQTPIHATMGGIWKCTGLPANPMWTLLPAPPRSEKRPTQVFVLNNGDILAVYGARDSTSIQPAGYTFTASGGVFISHDQGMTWVDLCSGYPGMQYDARYLTIDPHDPAQNTWFLGAGSSGIGSEPGLYRTTDRGVTWMNVWPGKTVYSVTMHPEKNDEMYICSASDGLFYATDANTNTPDISAVSSYPFKAPERVFFNPYNGNEVWVTSLGNGLRVGTISPVGADSPENEENSLVLYPNPASGEIRLHCQVPLKMFIVKDLAGRTVYRITNPKEENTLNMQNLPRGIYFYQANDRCRQWHGKIIRK
ncbi:MAG: T9SS type A sorting domain-containing protein [Bacteroidales bacterium]